MLLNNKTAVIYGAGGAMGGVVARVLAREGARVFLAGRMLDYLDIVARDISGAGGVSERAEVDDLDKQSTETHLNTLMDKNGQLDILFNVIGLGGRQGSPLVEMAVDGFTLPIVTAMETHFLTATAAARHMALRGSGVSQKRLCSSGCQRWLT